MVHGIPDLWDAEPGYFNTASFGLPPRPTWHDLQAALEDWRVGRTSWETWSEAVERARHSFARLTGAAAEDVATGSQVSPLVGFVAAALPPGSRVVVPEIDFTSVIFPFLVHEHLEVVPVPAGGLLDAIDERTTAVAYSVVQSATGQVTDMAAVHERAHAYGALTIVDATQAVGWLPVDAAYADALVCGAYKWLMSPRGTAFMVIDPALAERVTPLAAGWTAGEDPQASYYGPPLRLTGTARRFDVSPGWFDWIGTAASLAVVESIGVHRVHAHDVGLANRFRAGLGLPPGNSAIVTLDDGGRLSAKGFRVSTRAGSTRVAFHLYTTEGDVDAALSVLG